MDRLLGEEGVRAAAWLEPGGVSGPLTGVTLSASAEITFIALGGRGGKSMRHRQPQQTREVSAMRMASRDSSNPCLHLSSPPQ